MRQREGEWKSRWSESDPFRSGGVVLLSQVCSIPLGGAAGGGDGRREPPSSSTGRTTSRGPWRVSRCLSIGREGSSATRHPFSRPSRGGQLLPGVPWEQLGVNQVSTREAA